MSEMVEESAADFHVLSHKIAVGYRLYLYYLPYVLSELTYTELTVYRAWSGVTTTEYCSSVGRP